MYRDSTQLHLQGINFHGDNQSNNTNRCLEYLTRSRAPFLAWTWYPVRDLNPCYHLERVAS